MQDITLSGPSANHPLILARLSDTFVALDFTDDDFEKAKDRFHRWVDGQRRDAPYLQLFRHLERINSNFPWRDDEILAAEEQINPEQLRAFHREVMHRSLARVYPFANNRSETFATMLRET